MLLCVCWGRGAAEHQGCVNAGLNAGLRHCQLPAHQSTHMFACLTQVAAPVPVAVRPSPRIALQQAVVTKAVVSSNPCRTWLAWCFPLLAVQRGADGVPVPVSVWTSPAHCSQQWPHILQPMSRFAPLCSPSPLRSCHRGLMVRLCLCRSGPARCSAPSSQQRACPLPSSSGRHWTRLMQASVTA